MANSMSDQLKLVKLERDSISNLPDSLLHHILTFLPTREAVATSLLSKRWRPLWLSMPTFDFDCRNFHSLDSFTQFVDAVLSMTDSKTTIEKFRLRSLNRRVDHLELRFSSWDKVGIRFFINDEDDVDVDDDVPLLNVDKLEHLVSANIPSHLFTWKAFTNVTFLSLMTYTASGNDYFPRFDHLTHLEFECLYDEDLNWIVEVLPNCPKLEILDIDEAWKDNGTNSEVPQCISSQLKEFILGAYDGSECEFQFVRFIMKNARVLRTISIFSCSSEDKKYGQMLKRLSSCPRGSENCRLLFDEVSVDASV
ncbi:F-box/FBD/LRR-repeat protein At5g56420-like [Prosopis cineraria]|uniref:F-box/FBD/LRR-repeat protein At5g56420-like n=1 Tax=Prosopis cineraria TaxID=364024 RepID=UPI0024104FBC|nr:F-box/FBD/LRR-repeat protein At5g56420-like [Prosopis cineraria]